MTTPIRQLLDRRTRRRAGVAMMMLLIALTIGTILAVSFMTSQVTTIGISSNLQNQLNARMIAESGLEIGVQAINSDANWRTDYTSGTWVTNQSFGGGTYTLKCEDGDYDLSSGAVVGDGSLSNNVTDDATVTCTSTYNGVSYTIRALVSTTADTENAPTGLCAEDSIALSTSAYVDAFDSAQGAYGGANILTNKAEVSTNSIAAGKLALSGSAKIWGDASCGPSGTANSVITTSGSATVTGSKSAMTDKVNTNLPTVPAGLPSSTGALYISSGTTTLAANAHYSSVTVTGTGILNITANVTVQCDGSLIVSSTGQVTLGAVGAAKFYVGGAVQVANTGQIAVSTGDPTRLQIFLYTAGQNVTLDTSAKLYGEILATRGLVSLTGSAQLFGNVDCKQFTADTTTAIHLDIGVGGSGVTSSDVGNKTTLYTTKTKSVQNKQVATQISFPTAVTVQSISIYGKVGSKTRLLRAAIYTDSAGSPGTLVAQSSSTTFGSTTLKWYTVTMPPTAIAAGAYWLAISSNASGFAYYNNGTGVSGSTRYRNNAATASGYLATWGTSDSSYVRTFNIYATVTSGGVPTGITTAQLPIYSYSTTWGEKP